MSNYSWRSLDDVYSNKNLKSFIEKAEKLYRSTDETPIFAKLVNTSTSNRYPYHRWIRYREGYAGELVKEILRRYPPPKGSVILDPMCGSGSTMVACNELGIPSIGLDVSPFAVLATECKGFSLNKTQISDLLKSADDACSNAKKSNSAFSRYDEDLDKYFDRSNLQQLVNLKRIIKAKRPSKVQKLLKFALYAVLEDCSNRKKDGNGLATRKTFVNDCYAEFLKKIDVFANDFEMFPHSFLSTAIVHDAKNLQSINIKNALKGRNCGSIIFSPPYANSFDYFESYKLELIFSEWATSSELRGKRVDLIRNYRLVSKNIERSKIEAIEMLCNEIEQEIPEKEKRTGVRDGRTRLVPNMLRAYFKDMEDVIKTGMDMLDPGQFMHIVVDQSAYVGVPIPTDTILANLAELMGHKIAVITQCRKANTSGQQLKQYPYLSHLLRESIVTIQKT